MQLCLQAQTYDSDILYAHYKGVIAEKYPITMDLAFKGDKITGFYQYDKVGNRIILDGTIDKFGQFEIIERVNDEKTGVFSGKKQGQQLSGIWQNVEKTKQLTFTAKEDYSHSAHLKYLVYSEKVKMFDTSDIAICNIYGNLVVPTTTPSRAAYSIILQKLRHFYFGENLVSDDFNVLLGNRIQQIAKDYKDLDMTYDDVAEDTFVWNWEENFSSDIVLNQNDFLIIKAADYFYEGGAHGMFTVDYVVYDLQTGEQWNVDDIILKNKADELSKILYTKVEPASLFDDGDKTLYPSDIVYFTMKNIIFVYNPYDVGPWSSGVIEATVGFDEIKDFLTEKFKKRINL